MLLDDEIIDFVTDEAPPAEPPENDEVWKLLIVDDDEEVHEATLFALQGIRLCGRRLQLIHAHSAAEAAAIMGHEAEIAVLLLDVVMESPDAGLRLIKRIRQDLQRTEVRIVLRTGQPGQAPELEVIRDYDINDYKTKAELTHTRLITTLIAAIRSYEQLQALNDNQRGLEIIVSGAADLMQAATLGAFAKQALAQITTLLRLPGDGLLCAEKGGPLAAAASEEVYIVAATGNLATYSGRRLDQLGEPEIAATLKECINRQRHSFGHHHIALYLRERNQEAILFVRSNKVLTTVERQLAEVFAANVATCFGNVRLVERLNFIAYHDPLTGLANRARFLSDLGTAGVLAKPGQVVCLLDVIHFTDINNALGQEVGDRLLIAIARRLSYACRDCRLAHIGADRFGLLGDEAQLAPERMLALMAEPFAAGEHQLQVDVNLGYCRITGGEAGGTLFKHADMALTQARLSPNVRHIHFAPDMEAQTHWRLDVIRRLRHDFQAGQLEVWYQPQVSLADGSLVGLEALARWPGDGAFVHPPAVFIKLAEDAGLIVDIGAWVLERSCDTYRSLLDAGHAPHHIAVNVSMPQFRQPDFPARVMATLAAHGMLATALELEITESLLLDEPAVVLLNLETLRQAGVLISIDDFGTGYSSLSYLRQLPIDCLKIDRSFVVEIDNGKGDLFAQTIVELAQKLGIETVAEGVETQAQVDRLRELGCDTVQGFLYAYPMPAGELAQWCAGRGVPGSMLN
ncbi:putative bifunctional diguanylate cyclase/phosphodiesterase [Dechloromonas sp. A34]|uniref:putative bifunctional diguanylate cyclase/phosphodiesterase n=1 Tax=Dechloromonas sp. A34 TaxID=447588 RepID=UPI0022492F46|nr:EAL domain-containing protein [Dechloromonas sp. A34]